MSIEPGFLDANILVYALNVDAPQYPASRSLLDAGVDPTVKLYVTSQILCEFYSIITNPRRVAMVSSPAEALDSSPQCLTCLPFKSFRSRQTPSSDG